MISFAIDDKEYSSDSIPEIFTIINQEIKEQSEIWFSFNTAEYPCMAICTNNQYAAVTLFENKLAMWLSYNKKNKAEIDFIAGGVEWIPEPNAVISLEDAFLCAKEFLNTNKKPICIDWQDL